LADELGEGTAVLPCDLSDAAACAGLVGQAEAALGQVDILVNNAGLTRDSLALRMKDEDWELVLRVNLGSAFRLSRAALRGMMKRRWGRIVGITSVVGVIGNPGQANYAASKAGMIGMTKSLAMEVASRGITVNCIAPGFIETAMTGALDEGQKEKLLATIPSGRLGSASATVCCKPLANVDELCYEAAPRAENAVGERSAFGHSRGPDVEWLDGQA
jgi:3-oxoacyl-[acyl-carrier protein] reductase